MKHAGIAAWLAGVALFVVAARDTFPRQVGAVLIASSSLLLLVLLVGFVVGSFKTGRWVRALLIVLVLLAVGGFITQRLIAGGHTDENGPESKGAASAAVTALAAWVRVDLDDVDPLVARFHAAATARNHRSSPTDRREPF
jgi:hypothetical protein